MNRLRGKEAIRNFNDESGHHHYISESLSQQICCLFFREHANNSLEGFADLGVGPLLFKGCAIHQKSGKRWVNFPARQYKDDAGVLQWQALIAIPDKAAYCEFQKSALEAVDSYRRAHPEGGEL